MDLLYQTQMELRKGVLTLGQSGWSGVGRDKIMEVLDAKARALAWTLWTRGAMEGLKEG